MKIMRTFGVFIVSFTLMFSGIPVGGAFAQADVVAEDEISASAPEASDFENPDLDSEVPTKEESQADEGDASLSPEEDRASEETQTDEGDASLSPEEDRASEEKSLDTDSRSNAEANLTSDVPLKKGTYLIRTSLSYGKVFDIASGSTADGANVQLYSSNMTSAQKFKVTYDDRGLYTFTNVNSGRVLDVKGGKAKAGTNVQQYKANRTLAQKWIVQKNDDGSYTVKSALNKNLVLDISGGSSANKANVQIYSHNGSKAQKVHFISTNPVVKGKKTLSSGIYEIKSKTIANKAIDVSGASISNGAKVQSYTSNKTMAQRFRITFHDDADGGSYSIRALHSGKALDVTAGNLVARTKVQQWAYSSSSKNQRWIIRKNDDNTYAIISKANGLALEVSAASTADGAQIQTHIAGAKKAQQKWVFQQVNSLIDEGLYRLSPRHATEMRVDITGGSRKEGAQTQLYTNNGTLAQKYLFSKVSGGEANVYTIESLCSGKRLAAEGSRVVQKSAANTNAQKWKAAPNAKGGISLKNIATGKVLDVAGGSTKSGTSVRLYQYNGTQAQGFMFTKTSAVTTGNYVIVNASNKNALDVANASLKAGANVQTYTNNSSGAQRWSVNAAEGKWRYLTCAISGKRLDVKNGTAKVGTNVQQSSAKANQAQKWSFEYLGNGYFRIISACGNYSLATTSSGNVHITTKSNDKSQKWILYSKQSWPSGNTSLDSRLTTIKTKHIGDSGDVLKKSFNYVAKLNYRSGSLYPTGNWSIPFAIEMNDKKSGNCYRFAALFCWLARSYGYDAKVVSGAVPSLSQGRAPHGWVEIKLNGKTYVCDPDMAHALPSYNWYMTTYANAPIKYYK